MSAGGQGIQVGKRSQLALISPPAQHTWGRTHWSAPRSQAKRLGHATVWPETQPDQWVRLYV